MRLFIGVEIDERVRAAAARIADALARQLRPRIDARWIPESNLHITLVFIGEVDDARSAAILQTVDQAFAMPGFDIHVGGLGAFPPSGPPRVLWIGVGAGAGSLIDLYGELAERLATLGIPREPRPYSPHLTIARVKAVLGRDYAGLRTMLRGVAAEAGTCRVQHVTVFRSRVSAKGAVYEPLLRVPLQ
jgi:2'-5' RNA ligase